MFNNGEQSLKINGIECFNRLECYISVYEHEILHLVLLLFCKNYDKKSGGHTKAFKLIANNLFSHTLTKHMLLSGDCKLNDNIKKNIKVGSYVITKEHNNNVYKGIVVKVNTKTIMIKLDNGNTGRISFSLVDKIIND